MKKERPKYNRDCRHFLNPPTPGTGSQIMYDFLMANRSQECLVDVSPMWVYTPDRKRYWQSTLSLLRNKYGIHIIPAHGYGPYIYYVFDLDRGKPSQEDRQVSNLIKAIRRVGEALAAGCGAEHALKMIQPYL